MHEVFANAAMGEMGGVDVDVADNAHLSLHDRFFAPETMDIAESLISVYDVLVMHEISLYGFIYATPNIATRTGNNHTNNDSDSDDMMKSDHGYEDDDASSNKTVSTVSNITMHLRDSLLPALLLRWTSLLPMVNALINAVLNVGCVELLRVYRDTDDNYDKIH